MKRMTDADVIGLVFGLLTVTHIIGRTPSRKRIVRCKCECGGTTDVCLSDIRNGHTRSCGCLFREASREKMKKIRHLGERNRLKHGQSNEPEYYIWRSMKARCKNPRYKSFHRYGGRGINFSTKWASFDTFFADMGKRPSPKHQLERIDNNGHYSKDNCRWATAKEQGRNKSTNKLITFRGETLTATEWAERIGVGRGDITRRIKAGWTLEKALTTPKLPRNLRTRFNHN